MHQCTLGNPSRHLWRTVQWTIICDVLILISHTVSDSELGCSVCFQFCVFSCVSWRKRSRISRFPQSGRVKWDFTSPHGNDSPRQTLALKTARPSRVNTQRWHIYEHRPSVHLFRKRVIHVHTHTQLTSFSELLGRLSQTRAHTHLDYRAVTDLPMKAPHKPRVNRSRKSALQQCSSCIIVNVVSVAVLAGWDTVANRMFF